MSSTKVISSALLVFAAALSGHAAAADGASSGATTVQPAAVASIDAPLFYNFPVKSFAFAYITDSTGRVYGSELSKAPNQNGVEGHWLLRANTQYSSYSSRSYYLDLETGDIGSYAVHSGGERSMKAPAKGGDYFDYMDSLFEMRELIQQGPAPQDVQAYIKQVIDFVTAQNAFAVKNAGALKTATATVHYRALTKVDVLVDVFHVPNGLASDLNNGGGTWVTKGRTTVEAGTGDVEVLLDRPSDDEMHTCLVIKLLPVGGDYSHPLASSTDCSAIED